MNNKTFHLSNISPACMMRHLARNCWMIVAGYLILSMAVSLYFSWFHTPEYKADMTYAVTSRKTSYASGANVTSAKEVAAVMAEMLETGMVINNVRSSSPRLSDFDGIITATQVSTSNLIVISVTDDSPEEAVLALQALQDIFPKVTSYISSGSVVQMIRNPYISTKPVNVVDSSRLSRLAGLAGAALMVVLICWFVLQRETVQTRSGARNLLDSNIIAAVTRETPRMTLKRLFKKEKRPLQVFSPTISFAYTEQINAICTKLEQEAVTHGSKIFLITGAGENEGKSTIAGNVAAALSMRGKRVALLDCDLRNPSLGRFFDGKYAAPLPLNQLLAGEFSKENLLACMQRHDKLGIFMLFSNSPDRRCTELLNTPTMDTLLRQLRVFDFVLLDTPPMGYFVDAETLADKVDASVLVVRQDRTPAAEINDAVDILRSCSARYIGCILNDMTASVTEGYGYGYGYGYGRYGYGRYGYGHYGYGYGYGSSNSKKRSKRTSRRSGAKKGG